MSSPGLDHHHCQCCRLYQGVAMGTGFTEGQVDPGLLPDLTETHDVNPFIQNVIMDEGRFICEGCGVDLCSKDNAEGLDQQVRKPQFTG